MVSFSEDPCANMDTTGDPWNGHTLDGPTLLHRKYYNFGRSACPLSDIDAFIQWMKEKGQAYVRKETYAPIHMPKNTKGLELSLVLLLRHLVLQMILHIWWWQLLGFSRFLVTFIVRAYTNRLLITMFSLDEIARSKMSTLDNVPKGYMRYYTYAYATTARSWCASNRRAPRSLVEIRYSGFCDLPKWTGFACLFASVSLLRCVFSNTAWVVCLAKENFWTYDFVLVWTARDTLLLKSINLRFCNRSAAHSKKQKRHLHLGWLLLRFYWPPCSLRWKIYGIPST